ncbi:unnamed protein product [Caenorhabditis bovis]|uniref:Uncharacterized protein n=1 Tax=Caenorhabditis bovis TaxID=2654633 RepID=A0A8S1F8Y2_9PELO|nr:unnamed protein product [Caenorhabditis bovis]
MEYRRRGISTEQTSRHGYATSRRVSQDKRETESRRINGHLANYKTQIGANSHVEDEVVHKLHRSSLLDSLLDSLNAYGYSNLESVNNPSNSNRRDLFSVLFPGGHEARVLATIAHPSSRIPKARERSQGNQNKKKTSSSRQPIGATISESTRELIRKRFRTGESKHDHEKSQSRCYQSTKNYQNPSARAVAGTKRSRSSIDSAVSKKKCIDNNISEKSDSDRRNDRVEKVVEPPMKQVPTPQLDVLKAEAMKNQLSKSIKALVLGFLQSILNTQRTLCQPTTLPFATHRPANTENTNDLKGNKKDDRAGLNKTLNKPKVTMDDIIKRLEKRSGSMRPDTISVLKKMVERSGKPRENNNSDNISNGDASVNIADPPNADVVNISCIVLPPTIPAASQATPAIIEAPAVLPATTAIPENPAIPLATPAIQATPAVFPATTAIPEAPAALLATPAIQATPAVLSATPAIPETPAALLATPATRATLPASPVISVMTASPANTLSSQIEMEESDFDVDRFLEESVMNPVLHFTDMDVFEAITEFVIGQLDKFQNPNYSKVQWLSKQIYDLYRKSEDSMEPLLEFVYGKKDDMSRLERAVTFAKNVITLKSRANNVFAGYSSTPNK